MTNIQIMKKHLETIVLQPLYAQGFTGKYPHLRKDNGSCIELITFQTNKYGGSFTVEVSAVFPHKDNKNFASNHAFNRETLNAWDTNARYRLKGMYDGWFYYSDLYSKFVFGWGKDYLKISENGSNHDIPKGYRLVQKFDDHTAEQICFEVNRQLEKGFKWLKKFEKANL